MYFTRLRRANPRRADALRGSAMFQMGFSGLPPDPTSLRAENGVPGSISAAYT